MEYTNLVHLKYSFPKCHISRLCNFVNQGHSVKRKNFLFFILLILESVFTCLVLVLIMLVGEVEEMIQGSICSPFSAPTGMHQSPFCCQNTVPQFTIKIMFKPQTVPYSVRVILMTMILYVKHSESVLVWCIPTPCKQHYLISFHDGFQCGSLVLCNQHLFKNLFLNLFDFTAFRFYKINHPTLTVCVLQFVRLQIMSLQCIAASSPYSNRLRLLV